MQVVVAGLFVFQVALVDVRLPDGVGAPQALLQRGGVEAVGLGGLPCFVGLGHQGLVAVEEVGGHGGAALRDALGDSSAEGVVAVAGVGAGLAA